MRRFAIEDDVCLAIQVERYEFAREGVTVDTAVTALPDRGTPRDTVVVVDRCAVRRAFFEIATHRKGVRGSSVGGLDGKRLWKVATACVVVGYRTGTAVRDVARVGATPRRTNRSARDVDGAVAHHAPIRVVEHHAITVLAFLLDTAVIDHRVRAAAERDCRIVGSIPGDAHVRERS